MRIWILQPVDHNDGCHDRCARGSCPWSPWYDKAFGFVVRAADEGSARRFAADASGDEGRAWLDAKLATCAPLDEHGEEGVVMRDYCRA